MTTGESDNPAYDAGETEDEFPGQWICHETDCGHPVEANPPLFLSLADDGTWSINGVGDDGIQVVCTERHPQNSLVLDKSLSAFLEETFPGCTWQGSCPLPTEQTR